MEQNECIAKQTTDCYDMTITEEQNENLLSIATQIEELEDKLKAFSQLQESYASFKARLLSKMEEYNVDNYTSFGGIRFTRVAAGNDKTIIGLKFDEEKLKLEKPDIYKQYTEQYEKTTKGRISYLRITIPKEKGDE